MSDYPDFEEINNEDLKLSIQKFEQILCNDVHFYFDVDEFSEMIDYYLSKIESGKPGAGENAWLFVDEIEIK